MLYANWLIRIGIRKIPRIDHALKDHFYPYIAILILRVAGESAMTYTYRGVTYTKKADQKTIVKTDRQEKIYRGTAYVKLPKVEHQITEHVYRGVKFAA